MAAGGYVVGAPPVSYYLLVYHYVEIYAENLAFPQLSLLFLQFVLFLEDGSWGIPNNLLFVYTEMSGAFSQVNIIIVCIDNFCTCETNDRKL
jgi:hypothetical protein